MQIETKSRTIGSHVYHVRQLGSSDARKLLVRLTSTLGPVLGAAIPQGVAFKDLLALDIDFGKGLSELATRLKEDDLEYVCRVLGSASQVDLGGGKLVLLDLQCQELHFRGGQLKLLFQWLQFALEVQFSDFFPGSALAQSA